MQITFDGRGGEGRRIVLTWLQKQKREQTLPDISNQYDKLQPELRAAIAKAACVPADTTLKNLSSHQRWALRRAADSLAAALKAKNEKAKRAAYIIGHSCTDDEPVRG